MNTSTLHSDWKVQFLTRKGCHLCEGALKWIHQQQLREGFVLEIIDIDDNPDYQQQYDQCVPVVIINGKVRFRGRINANLWKRLKP